MSIHKVFSTNLRERCLELGTIADACNRASINRQQFNRYLSGASLPNARTLSRICEHLNVRDEELFTDRKRSKEEADTAIHQTAHLAALFGTPMSANAVNSSLGSDPPELASFLHSVTIVDGYYSCYFPVQNLRGFVVRTLLRVRRVNDTTGFKRLTLFWSPARERRVLAFSKHYGIVLANRECHYFLGKNTNSDHGVSLLAIEKRTVGGTSLHRGLGLVQSSSSPMACQVCLELLPAMTSTHDIREAISSLGIVGTEDTRLNPLVSALFGERKGTISNQVSVPDIETAPRLSA
jgi:transcriptional regulator with XRE-family HTH domain